MKILTVIGARPQFIKAAPVARAMAVRPGLEEILVHTGQHFDANMSDVFFKELDIPQPRYNLGIGGGSHGENTGRMIEGLERVMRDERPAWVLVYGDTDSTLAGALAATKLHIPVAHVEAGLRSRNMLMPEEVNRKLTDHVSTLLFTPSVQAIDNLRSEGIAGDAVINAGDVMYDAALMFGEERDAQNALLTRLGVHSKGYVLATVHRQENTDDRARLGAILEGLGAIERPVVLPLHPRTRARIAAFDMTLPANVIETEPLGYMGMIMLERHAVLIATDSGGVQKEAYFQRVPCVTLRDETEWTELIDLGWNRLARPGTDDLVKMLREVPEGGSEDEAPYGDGQAAMKIVTALAERSK